MCFVEEIRGGAAPDIINFRKGTSRPRSTLPIRRLGRLT
jgi:hypothetical protein